MPSFNDELTLIRHVASAAGDILTRHFGTGLDVQLKGWADPVTAADRESETFIRKELAAAYPDDGLDGEEEGRRIGSSGRLWLIDPLDGTADFAAGLPVFAVVITLLDLADHNHALLNVTYDPIRRETFHAIRGEGAFLEDKPIRVTPSQDVAGALVHLHFSNQRAVWEKSVELARRVTAIAPHARNLGSSALAQAYVACGRLGGHVKVVSGMHDVVGGNLLIEEAGGVVTDLDGRPWRERGSLLASAPGFHAALLERTKNLA
jgi:myo-inositol-1(or 4)-monophosphatase